MSNYADIASMMVGGKKEQKEQKTDNVANSTEDTNMYDLAWQYFNMVLKCNPSSYSIVSLTDSLAVPEFGLYCYLTAGALIDKCMREDCLVDLAFFERLRETLDKIKGSLNSAIKFKYTYRDRQGNPKQFDTIFSDMYKTCDFLDVILRRKTPSNSDINKYVYVMLHNSILSNMTDAIYYGPAQRYTIEGTKNGIYVKTGFTNGYWFVYDINGSTKLSTRVCYDILEQAKKLVGVDSSLSAGVKVDLKLILDSFTGGTYSTEFKFSNISKFERWIDGVSKMIESGKI